MTQPTIQDVDAAVRSVLSGGGAGSSWAGRPAEVFAERLLSLRQAEALAGLAVASEVRVAPGTVVTPLARDFLKRQGIGLRVVSRSEADGARDPGEWGFAIENESGLISAFRRALLAESRPWLELEPSPAAAARWVTGSPGRGAMLLTDEASVAVWNACHVPGARAASAADVDTVDRAIRRLGMNLLVVEPAGKSISLMRQMSATFRRTGAPRVPRGLEREREAEACGSPK
jgi:hypothetical protein